MIIATTKKIKNKILAISIAEPAIRVNPNSAATIAMTKNVAAHRNIVPSPPAGKQALFLSSFIIYLPIFSIFFPVSDMSFPAPLSALHPKSEVIKIRASKLNKVNFFIFVRKDNTRATPISAGCLLLCLRKQHRRNSDWRRV